MSDKDRDIEMFFGDPSQGGAQKEELFERSEFSSFSDDERQWVKKHRETRDLSDIRRKLASQNDISIKNRGCFLREIKSEKLKVKSEKLKIKSEK